mgnify:CR=1 FL=1|tara:strand:+ start:9097 stop:9357 length:261 start_codon:yes stop_codon:yes gene_type:complete
MSEEDTVVRIGDFRQYKENMEDADKVVEQLGQLVDLWKEQNMHGGLISFVAIAFFSDIIKQLAPDESVADEFIQNATKHTIFDREE